MKINIKPLSVNEVWRGRRFKTEKYKQYENDCFLLLPGIPVKNPTHIDLVFGVSTLAFDFDNGIKPFVDILQKKYGFNDRYIMSATIKKVKTKKGEEFVEFDLR